MDRTVLRIGLIGVLAACMAVPAAAGDGKVKPKAMKRASADLVLVDGNPLENPELLGNRDTHRVSPRCVGPDRNRYHDARPSARGEHGNELRAHPGFSGRLGPDGG